ncbi:MAG: adenylate/guanylate cyclase domain-containing protein [Proteobacteria bacterium]|nr:adenylate/guanylate cyclase domain-containing protein [Pseudomonadota bacterium]MBI3497130.1 adenylate/guanylate cyclase domain-containing protein [Pseudomonadota bacterium]
MRFFRRLVDYSIPIAMLALALSWRVIDPGELLGGFRLRVFDAYQVFAPREPEAAPVRVVDIDEESLARIGQWPWPRTVMAKLIGNLAEAGAAVVALDMMFPEPDRTSPTEVVRLWADAPELVRLKEAISGLPDHDRLLAEAIGQARVVTGFTLTATPGRRPPQLKGSFAVAGDDPNPFIPSYVGAVVDLEPIEKAAAGNGSLNLVQDPDGMTRRVPLVLRLGSQLYPSLVAEVLRVGLGARTFIVKASGANQALSFGANTGINTVKIGPQVVPTDSRGQVWLHFRRRVEGEAISAWRVLSGEVAEDEIGGNIMVVGTSAAGLFDLRTTPLDPALPGVQAHAQALEQILLGQYLERPDWADGAEISFLLVLGTALIIVIARVGALVAASVGVAAIAAAFAGSWYGYEVEHVLVDPVVPSVASLAVYLAGSLLTYMRTEAEKRQVRGAFAQYLSPALVDELARDPGKLKLGGETRDMTFLFCDVRGFTSISEGFKANPQGLTQLINRFLTPMTNAILARRGTIDKYMGDCVMAFWNAPIEDREHGRHACEAALSMLDELTRLNERLADEAAASGRPHRPLAVGIGLNSGEVVVGNMGSEQRFDYSVLGDAVNLASRLEGQSKTYGMTIVIGEETRAKAPDFAAIELDLIAVKGKKEAVRIYALMGPTDLVTEPSFQAFGVHHAAMIKAYRAQDWEAAERALAECRGLRPDLEALYQMFAERIGEFRSNPPVPGWDGVYVAKSK